VWCVYADFQIRMNMPTTDPVSRIRNPVRMTGLAMMNDTREVILVMNQVSISVALESSPDRVPAVEDITVTMHFLLSLYEGFPIDLRTKLKIFGSMIDITSMLEHNQLLVIKFQTRP